MRARGQARPQPGEKPKTAGTASPGHRCSHCIGSGKRRKVFFVKRRTRDVYPQVRALVEAAIALGVPCSFRKEDLAVQLGVREHCVHQAMARLNREGLVGQRRNRAPHDSSRDPWMAWGKGDSAWIGSTYHVRLPEDKP